MVGETTEAEDFRDEDVGIKEQIWIIDEPINEIEKAQKMAEERVKEKELKERRSNW